MKPKTCSICSKSSESQYPLCKNCWLACKLLDHNPRLLKRAANYCKKLARRKIREVQQPRIPKKWESAKQKADWYRLIRKKTEEHFKSEKAREKQLKRLDRKIRVVRDGVQIKEVAAVDHSTP